MTADELVAGYLDRLAQAGAGLPAPAREELLEQIADHIAAARAEASGDGPAVVRAILDRLGPPSEVAAAAAAEQPAAQPVPPRLFGPGTARETAAVLLCAVGWVLGLGWLLGLVLALLSPRWTGRQKLGVALLPVPTFVGLTIAHQNPGAPGFVVALLVLAGAAVGLVLGARLVRRAR